MKKLISNFLLMFFLLGTANLMAQAPQSFNYQAVIRDGSGNILANQAVKLKFIIHTTNISGPVEYSDSIDLTTDKYGMINHAVGTGSTTFGTFSSIDWSSTVKFLQVKVMIGTGAEVDLGGQLLRSVPFALNTYWNKNGNNLVYQPAANAELIVGKNDNSGGGVIFGNPNHGVKRGFPASGSNNNVGLFTTGGDINLSTNGTATGEFVLKDNGLLGVGTNAPIQTLDVNGRVNISNGVIQRGGAAITGTADLGLYSRISGNWMRFVTNNGNFVWYSDDNVGTTGLMALTAAGDLGLGTIAPGSQIHIVHGGGTTVEGFRLERQGGTHWRFYTSTVSNELWLYHTTNQRGVFNATSGAYTTVSDKRLKTNVNNIESVLSSVLNLEVKRYNFKDDESKRIYIGLIAQDVEKVYPELVNHSVGEGVDIYTMDYSGFGVLAIKAIQEQQNQINSLKLQIEALQNAMNSLTLKK